MTLSPNTQITQENVGLLKAGDRVKVSYHGTLWDGIGTVVDINTKWRSSVGVERKDVGTGNFTPDCITFVSRPALSPPAEGESDGPYSCIRCDNSTWNDDDICDACAKEARDLNEELDALEATPIPAPADHIGDATEKVDWERVGPKLVEALEPFAALADKFTGPMVEVSDPHPENPSRNIQPLPSLYLERAHQALAAAQPQSNGE